MLVPLRGERVGRGGFGCPFELVVVSLSRISCNLSPPLLQEKDLTSQHEDKEDTIKRWY